MIIIHFIVFIVAIYSTGCTADSPVQPSNHNTPQKNITSLSVKFEGHDHHEGHDHGDHKDDDHESHGDHKNDDHESHDDHKNDGHTKERTVSLSTEALKRSDIQVVPVRAGALEGSLAVPAEVQLNPDRVAHISPLVEGQLLSVDVTLGDEVKVGQKLVQLRSVELGQARAEFSRTQALWSVARKNRARQRRLRAEGINSERSLLEAELRFEQANAEREAASSRLHVFGVRGGTGPDMSLESPIAGIIVERHATRGENVSSDDTLFIISDLARVWVMGQVYEQHLAQVHKGMSATLTLNAYPERSWTGTVNFVGSMLDEETRTLPIRVELDNVDGLLRPGLFGSLRLASDPTKTSSVLIPQSAIQTVDGRTVVFMPGHTSGEFAAHPITIGRQGPRQAEILEGLRSGDRIVVQGSFILKSELIRGELGHGHAH